MGVAESTERKKEQESRTLALLDTAAWTLIKDIGAYSLHIRAEISYASPYVRTNTNR